MKFIKILGQKIYNFPKNVHRIPGKVKTVLILLLTGQINTIIYKLKYIKEAHSIDPIRIIKKYKEVVSILVTKHTLYVAYLIEKELSAIGCKVNISLNYDKSADFGQLYIVICPQMFTKLPKHFIVFQMEQFTLSHWFTNRYFKILKKAIAIFDYSNLNIEFLLKNGIKYNRIYYMPIGSFPSYEEFLNTKYKKTDDKKKIDVLFYGSPASARRQHWLNQLREKFNIYIASEIFGDKLYSLIRSSKVVINIHYAEKALLETTRLHEVISLGIPLISEESIDMEHHNELRKVVHFTPLDDINAMAKQIEVLLNNTDYYNQCILSIKNFTEQDKKFSNYFKRFLLAFSFIEFNEFYKSVNFIPHFETKLPRICLSLTETVERKKAFIKNSTHHFKIIEGLRHRKLSWLGCGMSYKYLLTKISSLGYPLCMICEDDVIFPEDFETKLSKILSYLHNLPHTWQLFSGLIADLHVDTKVLKVEEIDGIEYIHIDKMTSLVCNIYTPSIMDIIKKWDNTHVNMHTNTIDRFLESEQNLYVITTLPFLVKHSTLYHSTLWYNNLHYNEMIEKSEQQLREKVKIYKNSIKN